MNLTRFSLNEITLIGTVSKISPASPDKTNLRIEFDLVTNERFKAQDGQWRELPQYHHCNVVGKKAEQFNAFVQVGSYLWARGSVKAPTPVNGRAQSELASKIQIREWSILSQADIDQVQGFDGNPFSKGQS